MTYADKLKNPKWQRRRLEILSRDGWECAYCGDKSSELQIHHRWYERKREPWDHSDECLVTLCAPCHEARTELDDLAKVALGKMSTTEVAAFLNESGERKLAGQWIVFSRGPVDEFDEAIFREATENDHGFDEAMSEFRACSWRHCQELRQSPLRGECAGLVFFVFKLDANGLTFLCARKGEEARIMDMLKVPECHWQFSDDEGKWTRERAT